MSSIEKQTIFDSDIPNDKINLTDTPSVKIKQLKSDSQQELKLQIEGQCIDYSVINAIRRTVLMSIPIYAFNRSNVNIEVKKSRHMYNNDMIYNQLETLPIFDIPNDFDLENPELYLPTDVMKKLFSRFIQQEYSTDAPEIRDKAKQLVDIELNIAVKNNTLDYKFVTTHDAVLRVNGQQVDSYLKRRPIGMLVLKPSEEIYFRAVANLGIAKMHASYEATTMAIHNEITPTKYILWYKTLEQLEKFDIFYKACEILIKKLEYLRIFIEDNYKDDRTTSENIEIQLHGEDYTLGNLLATCLQKCPYTSVAAPLTKHPFMDNVIIKYALKETSKVKPIKVFIMCIDYLINVFQTIIEATKAIE